MVAIATGLYRCCVVTRKGGVELRCPDFSPSEVHAASGEPHKEAERVVAEWHVVPGHVLNYCGVASGVAAHDVHATELSPLGQQLAPLILFGVGELFFDEVIEKQLRHAIVLLLMRVPDARLLDIDAPVRVPRMRVDPFSSLAVSDQEELSILLEP